MFRTRVTAAVALILMTATVPSVASSHDLFTRGASGTVGVGHCAKGPCMKRANFATPVPHQHRGNGQCDTQGTGGYRNGARSRC